MPKPIVFSDLPVYRTDYGEDILPEEYLSAEGDWIGEFTRLISSHTGTMKIAIRLADHPELACPEEGWLCKKDSQGTRGCPWCDWISLDENSREGDV